MTRKFICAIFSSSKKVTGYGNLLTSPGPKAHELFTAAIRTVPVQPRHGQLWFRADGILLPKESKDSYPVQEKENRYRIQCDEARVIPDSSALATFHPESNSFALSHFGVPIYSDAVKNKERLAGILEGRRPHELQVALGNNPEQEVKGFEVLRHSFLNVLLEKGYKPHRGILRFLDKAALDELSKASIGYYPNPGLEFSEARDQDFCGIELYRTGLSEEQSFGLETWFHNLPR